MHLLGSLRGTQVTVSEVAPAGLNLISMAATGWICSLNTCTRSDALNGGASYPAITVTVSVAGNAASQLTNRLSVSGGGSAPASANDLTNIAPHSAGVAKSGVFRAGL